MNAETAQFVLFAVTGVGAVVWVAGLRFLVASHRAGKNPPVERFGLAERPENLIAGTAEVEGRPAELAAKAASVMARENVGTIGMLKILERTDDRVAFEAVGPGQSGGSRGQFVGRGQLRFSPAARGRTRIDYAVEVSGGRGLLLGGAIFQVLGLVALVAGFWLIRTYIIPNQDPAIRGQTFQMLQVVHVLWPPFLFGGLYRGRHTAVRTAFDTLVHNLPYHAD